MGIDIVCYYKDKSCGTCKYFQSENKPLNCGSALSYDGLDGVCTCKTGVNYGQGTVCVTDSSGASRCYQKLKLEDTTTTKAAKSIAKKAILKAIFKI